MLRTLDERVFGGRVGRFYRSMRTALHWAAWLILLVWLVRIVRSVPDEESTGVTAVLVTAAAGLVGVLWFKRPWRPRTAAPPR